MTKNRMVQNSIAVRETSRVKVGRWRIQEYVDGGGGIKMALDPYSREAESENGSLVVQGM